MSRGRIWLAVLLALVALSSFLHVARIEHERAGRSPCFASKDSDLDVFERLSCSSRYSHR